MFFDISSRYGKKMEMIEMALNANVIRRDVIADNIANADTPFFKRSEVTFESQLQRAVESEKEPEFPALLTDKRHIPFNDIIDYRSVRPRVQVEYDSISKNDKNNVDIDKEMIDATKNSLQYNALIESYSRNLKILDIMMR